MTLKSISNKPVGVIGAGSFGTAVANLLAHNADVLVYVRRKEVAEAMRKTRVSAGQSLAPNITPTPDLAAVVECCTVIFPIVPSQGFKSMIRQLAPLLKPHHILIHGTKGLDVHWPTDTDSGALLKLTRGHIKTMSELIRAESSVHQVGCLAGPNLASELAQAQPAAAVVASSSEAVVAQGHKLLRSDRFQVYTSKDLIGVELCGVLKNVIAIGAGCLGGLGYGQNTKALLISRGLIEMVYLGKAMGASIQPFLGLAGLGDLVATCASSLSRNYMVGYSLAQGETLSQILASTAETIEGVHTVKVIRSLLAHYQARAPITEMIYRVLFEELAVEEAIHYLMRYPLHVDVDFL
ncbi:MAG: NAD(P)H-dependent glycerol-3-phosphate dehydrogenase [Bacteroidota bacterium]